MNSSAMMSPITRTRRLEKPSIRASNRSFRSASPGRGWTERAISIARRIAWSLVRQYPTGGFDQIVDNGIRHEAVRRLMLLGCAISGAHQNAFRADAARERDVEPPITDRK